MGQIKLITFDVAGTTAKDDGLVVKAATRAMEFIGVEPGSATMMDVVDYVNATMGQRKIDVFMHLCNNDINKAEEAHDIFIESYISFVKGRFDRYFSCCFRSVSRSASARYGFKINC